VPRGRQAPLVTLGKQWLRQEHLEGWRLAPSKVGSVEVVAGSFRSAEMGGVVTSGVDKVSDGTNAIGSALMCDGWSVPGIK